MTAKIVPMTGVAIALALLLSCSTQPADDGLSRLTFVIDDVADEAWSHDDDGSFEVLQTVTAHITAQTICAGGLLQYGSMRWLPWTRKREPEPNGRFRYRI